LYYKKAHQLEPIKKKNINNAKKIMITRKKEKKNKSICFSTMQWVWPTAGHLNLLRIEIFCFSI